MRADLQHPEDYLRNFNVPWTMPYPSNQLAWLSVGNRSHAASMRKSTARYYLFSWAYFAQRWMQAMVSRVNSYRNHLWAGTSSSRDTYPLLE